MPEDGVTCCACFTLRSFSLAKMKVYFFPSNFLLDSSKHGTVDVSAVIIYCFRADFVLHPADEFCSL